jgi:hypothetical protein
VPKVCSLREDPDIIAIILRWPSQAALEQFLSDTSASRAEAATLSREPTTTEAFVSI